MAAPIPARQLPNEYRDELFRQIQTLMEINFIQESSSAYAALIFSVIKKDNPIKLCVGYCALNKKVVQRWLEDLLKNIRDSSVFIALDLKGACYHIPMHQK